ncbi:hypothetical protein M514_23319 [Trichuris suis]|uniref:Uncharacterized protein n=1 Tax=Trichuris suis TaxID=68888 RepID=A0A085N4S6_9BILA|nr:hypothetical protein M514_23319 [Trichuris suis]
MVEMSNGQKTERSKRRKVDLAKLEIPKVMLPNGRNTESHITEGSKRRMVKIPKVRTQIRNLEGTNDYLISETHSALYSLY